MNTRKVDFYKVEVKYSGRFEDYTEEDLVAMARAKMGSGDFDCFEYTKVMPVNEAYQNDMKVWLDNHRESNKLIDVWFSYIDDMVEYDENDDPIMYEY